MNPLHLFFGVFYYKTGEKWDFWHFWGQQMCRWPHICVCLLIAFSSLSLSLVLVFPELPVLQMPFLSDTNLHSLSELLSSFFIILFLLAHSSHSLSVTIPPGSHDLSPSPDTKTSHIPLSRSLIHTQTLSLSLPLFFSRCAYICNTYWIGLWRVH